MLTPCENLELIGHQEQQDLFLKSFESGRIPHAWILSGPEGIGKATFAYHMARYLLSGRQDGNTKCTSGDPHYRRMVAQSHGDVYILGREDNSEIPIDAVRQLNQFLNQTSREGGWRVVIVDGADRLNRNAANALLKRLEEPPHQTMFFLITSYPGKLLPTIRSRCQFMSFNPLSDPQLKKVFAILQKQVPDFASHLQGSPGRLLRLMEGKGPQIFEDLLKVYAGEDVPAFAQTYGADEESFRIVEDLLRNYLHNQILEKAQEQPSLFGEMTVNQSLDLYEKIEQLFNDCRQAQLDKKATLTCVLAHIKYKEAA